MQVNSDPYLNIPDVRDGLTQLERTILYVLYEARKEYGDRMIPTVLLYGRVVEKLDVSWEDFMSALQRSGGPPSDHSSQTHSSSAPSTKHFAAAQLDAFDQMEAGE